MAVLIKFQNFALVLLMAIGIITLFNSFSQSEASEDVKSIKLNQNIGAPSLKFLYCYSCGYRKMFDQYVTIINQKYPFMHIDGYNYDPPGINLFTARFLAMVKMIVIVCILSNINIFEYFNQPRMSWWQWCLENKIYACMMLFFVTNLLENHLMQSGAFEIALNEIPIWSKLESGRIPQPSELFQIIDSHMQLSMENKFHLDQYPK